MHLNIPPTTEGLLDERDVKRLHEFGEKVRKEFSRPCGVRMEKTGGSGSQAEYTLTFDSEKAVKYVVLEEDISRGQRIESFSVFMEGKGGRDFPVYQGTTVGNRKICPLYDPFALQNPLISSGKSLPGALKLKIKSARGEVYLRKFEAYEDVHA